MLFRRNIAGTDEVRELIASLQHLFDGPAFFAIDQEGGPVQRLAEPGCEGFVKVPAMRTLERRSASDVETLGRLMGEQLASVGFNLSFAPVLDVDTNPANPIIGVRAFSPDPQRVGELGVAYANGLAAAGILSCGKHFPGHGDTVIDSHLGLPRLPHDRARLDAVELVPFAMAHAALPTMMTAHILFEAIDPELPVTFSPHVIPPLLRDNLGYDGLVFSDDLEMKAVFDHFSPTEMAAGLVRADVDVALVCRDLTFAHRVGVALASADEADPTTARRARRRIATALAQIPTAQTSPPLAQSHRELTELIAHG